MPRINPARALAAAAIALTVLSTIPATLGCQGTTRAGTRYTLNPGRATQAFVPASVNDAHSAARRSLENLQYRIIEDNVDATQGILKAKTARNEDITVFIDQDSPSFSKVTILLGLPGIGDEDRQLMILNNIESELGINPR